MSLQTESYSVANTIRSQIEFGVLMSLGAHNFSYTAQDHGGLVFNARILPFNKNGKRSSKPRIMTVQITLNILDYYDIRVYYLNKFDVVDHYKASNIDALSLSRVLLALDWDGPQVLNPRVIG